MNKWTKSMSKTSSSSTIKCTIFRTVRQETTAKVLAVTAVVVVLVVMANNLKKDLELMKTNTMITIKRKRIT